MIQHQGVWLPDGEKHLVEWMSANGEIVDGRGTYQIKKLREALNHCRRFRTAVDVGAHCGLWSMQLMKRFSQVHAFEPVVAHQYCFTANVLDTMAEDAKVFLYPNALGECNKQVSMQTEPTSSGDTRVIENGGGDVEMKRLDDFGLTDVDFIKLDCEGYELHALRGSEKTISASCPVIIVEQKPGRAQRFGLPETGAVQYLNELGYHCARIMSGDYIMVPS